jgi:transcriptional regulator
MDSQAVRELTGKTQWEITEQMGASRSEISRTERRSDQRGRSWILPR